MVAGGGTDASFEGTAGKGHSWTTMMFGNFIQAKVSTTVRFGTATVGTTNGEAETSGWIPILWPQQRDAYANVTASKECGHNIDAHGQRRTEVNAFTSSLVKMSVTSSAWSSDDSDVQNACPPPPPPPPPTGGENCEWAEYAVFVYFEGQWWLIGDTWFELECEDGPANNRINFSTPDGVTPSRRIQVVLVPDIAFNGAGAASKILRLVRRQHAVSNRGQSGMLTVC